MTVLIPVTVADNDVSRAQVSQVHLLEAGAAKGAFQALATSVPDVESQSVSERSTDESCASQIFGNAGVKFAHRVTKHPLDISS